MRPNFGAEWAGSGTRCLRFARGVAPPGRKTRFRLLARLFRVGSLSHWVPPKGFFDASYIAFLLSQAFPGASALRSTSPMFSRRRRQRAEVRHADRNLVVGVARVGWIDVSNHPGVHRIAAGKAEVRHRRRRSPSYFCGLGVSWLNVSTALARVFRGQSTGLPGETAPR
jgi:hypothetical protein